jgi:hypothetical protein
MMLSSSAFANTSVLTSRPGLALLPCSVRPLEARPACVVCLCAVSKHFLNPVNTHVNTHRNTCVPDE